MCDTAFLWQSMKGERLGEALILVCSLFVAALYSSLSPLMPCPLALSGWRRRVTGLGGPMRRRTSARGPGHGRLGSGRSWHWRPRRGDYGHGRSGKGERRGPRMRVPGVAALVAGALAWTGQRAAPGTGGSTRPRCNGTGPGAAAVQQRKRPVARRSRSREPSAQGPRSRPDPVSLCSFRFSRFLRDCGFRAVLTAFLFSRWFACAPGAGSGKGKLQRSSASAAFRRDAAELRWGELLVVVASVRIRLGVGGRECRGRSGCEVRRGCASWRTALLAPCCWRVPVARQACERAGGQ